MKQGLARIATLQPAVYRGVIISFVALLASLGVIVSPQLSDSLIAVIGSLSTLIAAVWIRSGVTPNAKVLAYTPDPESPRVVAAGEAVTTAGDAAILDAVRTVGRHAAPE